MIISLLGPVDGDATRMRLTQLQAKLEEADWWRDALASLPPADWSADDIGSPCLVERLAAVRSQPAPAMCG